jgi:hypothetical protein
MPEQLLVTRKMVDSIKSDKDFIETIWSRKVICEDEYVYDKLLEFCAQLHLSAYGDKETLELVI